MRASKLSLLAIAAIYILSLFYFSKWERQCITNGGDSFGYYAYLPATFIHHDLKHLRYTIYARNQYSGLRADSTQPIKDVGEIYFFKTGVPIIKYTCGIAILESPAFFIAHFMAKIFSLPADGFSPVYLFMLFAWNILAVLLGFFVLRKVLLTFFSEAVTGVVLFGIGVTSTLYHFTVYNPGMSHGYLFTLYALLIYYTIRFHVNASYKNGFFIGLSVGMISLIRPNEAIAILIPILYGIRSLGDIQKKVLWLVKEKSFYLACVTLILCVTPQLAYWLYTTGHVVYYSYGGESFDFKHPHIYEGIFGYTNGWLAYSPVMILALAGIPLMMFGRTKLLLPLLVILPIHIYIIYSWWCWIYVNGIGSRPMIEMSALLAIPMGFFIQFVWKKLIAKIAVISLLFLFALQQFMFTWKHDRNILWTETVNQTFYWQTLFKTKLDYDDLVTLDIDEKQPVSPRFKNQLFENNFNDSISPQYLRDVQGNKTFSLLIDDKEMYHGLFDCSLDSFNIQPGDWIKVSFDATSLPEVGGIWSYVAMTTAFKHGDDQYKYASIRIQNKYSTDNKWQVYRFDTPSSGKVHYFTQVPYIASKTDKLLVYTCNTSNTKVTIDNLKVEVWQ